LPNRLARPVVVEMDEPLALVVDITGTSANYNQGLSKALAGYPGVVFRTAPYFGDRSAFRDGALKRDFLSTAAWCVDRWPAITRHRRLWKFLQLHGYLSGWRDVVRWMRRGRVPVLHIQWCKVPPVDLWMMRLVQALGIRVVYTVHNALPYLDTRESVRLVYQKLYRQADALVVLSRSVGQQVVDRVDEAVAAKIHVIPHGILELDCPMPSRDEARKSLGLASDAEVVLFVGRISRYKGIDGLIDAFATACQARPQLRLIIAGDPEEPIEPYLAQLHRLGVADKAQVHPRFVPEQFKAILYAAADLAIMPHREASQSGMGLEALAAGMPIVATRVGGLVELVEDAVNGFSVPTADPGAMAGALTRFFGLSRAARDAMGAASRALGRERFGWSTIAQQHVALYERLASRSHRPANAVT
jgi:glycosyltransferase involved in cell wall biosynthesis